MNKLKNVVTKNATLIKHRWMECGGISVPTAVKSSRNPVISCDTFAFTPTRSLTSVPSVFEPSQWRARWPPTSRPTRGSRITSAPPATSCSQLKEASRSIWECTQVQYECHKAVKIMGKNEYLNKFVLYCDTCIFTIICDLRFLHFFNILFLDTKQW